DPARWPQPQGAPRGGARVPVSRSTSAAPPPWRRKRRQPPGGTGEDHPTNGRRRTPGKSPPREYSATAVARILPRDGQLGKSGEQMSGDVRRAYRHTHPGVVEPGKGVGPTHRDATYTQMPVSPFPHPDQDERGTGRNEPQTDPAKPGFEELPLIAECAGTLQRLGDRLLTGAGHSGGDRGRGQRPGRLRTTQPLQHGLVPHDVPGTNRRGRPRHGLV